MSNFFIFLIMKLLKLLGRIEQGFMTDRRMAGSKRNWAKVKAAYKRNMIHNAKTHTLNVVSLHERNGSRGNGIGMGHRNRQVSTK